jgi:adenylyltransferase/sulfurtransferase
MAGKKLNLREQRRYNRQILIPEIGVRGQEKLKSASVIVVGAGGLGCPVLQYLVAAGVGKIGIVEYDTVDESNLHRQVLYGADDLGKLKSVIAKTRLENLNTFVEIEAFNLKLQTDNAIRILSNYDVVVDATDNLETRYAIDDACVKLGKPMVHGAIYKYEGTVTVFNYKDGPTYRFYNPLIKSRDYKNPQPSAVGLFGVLPGITGTYAANEVIKIITGTGEVLSGKVLLFNILTNTFNVFSIRNK